MRDWRDTSAPLILLFLLLLLSLVLSIPAPILLLHLPAMIDCPCYLPSSPSADASSYAISATHCVRRLAPRDPMDEPFVPHQTKPLLSLNSISRSLLFQMLP